jgi:sn-glycerol 3-phosphate transport system permease protein
MVENARSLNIAASLILVVGMIYILGPLYLTITTASQSYEFIVATGWPGSRATNCSTT